MTVNTNYQNNNYYKQTATVETNRQNKYQEKFQQENQVKAQNQVKQQEILQQVAEITGTGYNININA